MRIVGGTLVVLLVGLVAQWLWAAESQAKYVHLTSDCLTMSLRPAMIDSVAGRPEPMKLPSGQESYLLEVQVGTRFYAFCYGDVGKRDHELTQVRAALTE